jgi:WD40 repeat protein
MESGDPAPSPPQRAQFSLATLCLIVLFLPAMYMVFDRWRPWVVLHTFDGHLSGRDCISDDSKYLLSGKWEENLVEVHEIKSGNLVISIPTGGVGAMTSSISPNGKIVVVGNGDGTATLWDIGTRKPRFTLLGPTTEVRCTAFSRDSGRVLAGSDGSAWVWDTRTGNTIVTLKCTYGACFVSFSKDGKKVCVRDGPEYRIWETDTGSLLQQWREEDFGEHADDYFDLFVWERSPNPDRDLIRLPSGEGWYVCDSHGLLSHIPEAGDAPQKEFRALFTPSGEFIICGSKNTNVLRRRHPEWWWGHFVRPEVWIAAISGILLFRRYRRAQRLKRQPSAVLNN